MKRLVLLLFFCCWVSVGFAQQIMWDREWPGQGFNDIFSNITLDSDTNIVVSGTSNTGNGYPVHWVKYNKNGNQVWQKYGRRMESGEQDIITHGNGYLFAGSQQVSNPNFMEISLQWLGTNGDTLLNLLQGPHAPRKLLADNSHVYILGNFNQGGSNIDYVLLKLGNNGTTQLWRKTYGSIRTENASYLIKNRRGNLVMSGISEGADGNATITPYRPYLVEVNANGNHIRTKGLLIKGPTYTVYNRRFFHNIAETTDGNYIMSGVVQLSSSPSNYENFIAKLDTAFNIMWVYYDPVQTSMDGFTKVQPLSDGSYAVLMNGISAIPGDYHIVKVSASGQFVSRTTYNSPITGIVLTYDWEFLGDGSVVIAGKTSNNEAYIARLGNVGIPAVVSSVAEPIAKEVKLGQSYPNPAASETTIPYHVNPAVKEPELRICEIATGRTIQNIRLDVKAQQVNLDLKPIKQGVYSYTLLEDGMPTATKKMVVVK